MMRRQIIVADPTNPESLRLMVDSLAEVDKALGAAQAARTWLASANASEHVLVCVVEWEEVKVRPGSVLVGGQPKARRRA